MKQQLTQRIVNGLKPRAEEYSVADAAVAGLTVRVQPGTPPVYVVRYRVQGRQRRETLGPVSSLSLDSGPLSARSRAKALLAQVAAGVDPACEEAQRATLDEAFARAAQEHFKQHCSPAWTARVQDMYERLVKPVLGHRAVSDISRKDIAELHVKLSVRPTQANRTLAMLSKVFTLVEQWELRAPGSNPCKGIAKNTEKRREGLLNAAEVEAIHAALDELKTEGRVSKGAALAIRLLSNTGCRASEIIKLEWGWVNLARKEIRWRKSKTGFMVKPIVAGTVELFKAARQEAVVGVGHVCAADYDQVDHAWHLALKRAGVKHCGLHTLRHNYCTKVAEANLPLHESMALTGHRTPAMFLRYAHLDTVRL